MVEKYFKTLNINNTAIFLLLLFSFFQAFAQQGNPCNAAYNVTVGNCVSFGTNGSNNDYWNEATGCDGGDNDDSWASFTATSTTTYINYNSTNDAIVHLFTGTCATNMTALACVNDTTSGDETINYNTVIGTTYYVRVQRRNNNANMNGTLCISDSPIYCLPSFTNQTYEFITNVNFAGINNSTTGAAGGYADYSGGTCANVQIGVPQTLSVTIDPDANDYVYAWIDWNQNGILNDAGEQYVIASSVNTTGPHVINITPPVTALSGTTLMRVMVDYNNATPDPCRSATFGEAEDYCITVAPAAPCSPPTAQPSALNLVPSENSISGSFTAAAPAADSYLVIVSTNPIAPAAPVNGTTYTIGSVYQAGYTVVDNDSNTSFNATGLTTLTTYYFYIYSFNNLCTGGPLYLGTSPLTGNTTTTAAVPTYCTPTSWDSDGLYIDNLGFIGTLSDPPANASTFSANGYQDFTSLSPLAIQAQGEGVNITAHATGNVHLRGTWKAWVDWNKNGDFDDAGEEVYNIQGFAGSSVTFGFVIPAAQTPGNYRMRIRVNNGTDWFGGETFGFDFSPCDDFENGFWEDNYGETEDYLFTVIENCSAKIDNVTHGSNCGTGTVTLQATGTAGTTAYNWYANETGGAPIATTGTGSWTTPSISSTTSYWVTAYNGSCESVIRTEVVATIHPTPTLTFTTGSPEVCGQDNIIDVTVSGDTEITHLINENFEAGNLGVFVNVNNDTNGAAVDNKTRFQNRTSTIVPTTNVWFPAISSGFGPDRFALGLSDAVSPDYPTTPVQNSLTLINSVNTTDFLDLTLEMEFYYSRYYPANYLPNEEYVAIELSTDGGTTYPIEIQRFTANTGIGTRFVKLSYDLSAYINQTNLKIRIRHYSYAGTGWLPDGIAVDNIELYGTKPLNTAFNWISALPVDAYEDVACTIPYISGTPAVTVYIRPTLAQLEQGSYTFTASATLSNGCSASDDITINNKSKIWKGTNSNDWNDPNNWSPNGVPDLTTCVIIPDVTSTNPSNVFGGGYDAYGKTLQVKDNGNLQVVSGNTLTIQNFIEVSPAGTFLVENSASLIQIDNVANTGTLLMDRFAFTNSTLDYVYWSTPVAGYSVNNITPTASTYRYRWIPTVNNGGTYAGNFGNWTAASGAMVTGKGYIKRGLSGMTRFSGVPNNGDITTTISRSDYAGVPYAGPTTTLVTEDDDNWNLLGNPYPSAISADAFLAANSTNLEQFVKIWLHGIDPSAAIADPFYQNYTYNYSLSDYLTYNAFGPSMPGFDGYIGAGQGFFTLMRHTSPTMNSTAVFNNSMRSNTYRNDQFFRTANESTTQPEAIEKHRIWMKLIAPNGNSSDALVGYASGATNGLDDRFDAISGGIKANFEIYSLINNKEYAIQARSLPFDDQDQIPLGIVVSQSGLHTIALTKVDGIFLSEQAIYLEDLELGVIHDIKSAPYTFGANTGRYNNRFVLRFTNSALSTSDFENSQNVYVYANESINIASQVDPINEVLIYDTLGRVLYTNQNIDTNNLAVKNLTKTNSTLIVKVKLTTGKQKTFKVIY